MKKFYGCKSDISQKLYLDNTNRIQQQVYQLQNTYEEVSKAQEWRKTWMPFHKDVLNVVEHERSEETYAPPSEE